jgi:hypothetical protein
MTYDINNVLELLQKQGHHEAYRAVNELVEANKRLSRVSSLFTLNDYYGGEE